MTRSLRVSIAQINTTVGDFSGNQEKILTALRQAKREGAGLVTFPELALTGYPPEDLLFQERFVTENLKVLRSLLPHTRGLTAVVGFVDRDRLGLLYNAAAFISNGRIAAIYHKMKLPNYGVFDEKRYFTPGSRGVHVKLAGVRLSLTICEDIWQKDAYVYRPGYSGKAGILINISASPYHAGKQKERQALLRDLAVKTRSTVIYHNLVGGQDELVFDGGSMVVSSRGNLIAEARRFSEDFLTLDIPVPSGRAAVVRARKEPPMGREEEVYRALVLGTRDYVLKNGFKKVLIGLSGGIDSALVAQIAVDGLGAGNVVGVTMPSPYTSAGTLRDARRLAKNLGVRCLEIGIRGIFSGYLRIFRKFFAGRAPDTTEENVQARIRGTLLMALSNKFGYLVLTTGNKSETATGYCTLYGDMAGGFAVIKDVPKTLVYALSRYRNSRAPKNGIPISILKRPPTAELRPGQKDRDSLPPYPALDRFLADYVEKDLSIDTILRRGFPPELARKLTRMVDRNEYKRRQAPPGVKITPKAFGRDRRMPITNRYSL
ncbi:MAG: NAD+ synthase [Candidatus Omnitrophota bacterium]